MTDILREVEEELRREKMESFTKRWGVPILAAIAAGVATYGGFLFWQDYRVKQAGLASIKYDAALDALQEGKVDDGIAKLDAIAKSAPGGLKALAMLQKGAALAEKGDDKAAAAAYTAAGAATNDPILKDLAILKAAYSASTFETRAQIEARLAPIISKKESAFGPLARELSAMLAWSANDMTAARALYSTLQLDPNAPEGVRTRSQRALAVIDAKATVAATALPDAPAQGQAGLGGQQLTPEMIQQMQAAQAAQMQAQQQAQAQAVAQARAQQAAAQKAQGDQSVLQAIEKAKAVAGSPAPAANTPPAPEPAASPAAGNTP